MKLTLHIEWLKDEEPYETIKKSTLDIHLPNSDFYYAFEAWMNLSYLEERFSNECLDKTIDITYDIVMDACEKYLGLTPKMFATGTYEIDDPIAENENYGHANITIYVPKR